MSASKESLDVARELLLETDAYHYSANGYSNGNWAPNKDPEFFKNRDIERIALMRDEAIKQEREACKKAVCGFCREGDEFDEDFNGRGRYHKIYFGSGWDWVPCLAQAIRNRSRAREEGV